MKKWGFIIIILIVLGCGCAFFFLNQDATKNYQYKIEYHDGYNPGKTYEIYIQKNHNMLVIKPPICIIADCEEPNLKEKVSFSKEGKEKIKDYIKNLMKDEKEIKLTASDLTQNELIVMESIIYNDEVHLEAISEETKKTKNLLFELRSNRIDCDSVILKVYDDNTYQYIDVYEKENASYQSYAYDVSKIIENNSQYEENDHGPYNLKTSDGKVINVYDTNQELNEFLKEIEISLDVCIKLK